MALLIAVHHPAEPSARAISSTASNNSTLVPLRPPSAAGSRIENRLASSIAAATLSVSRPRRSASSASSLIKPLIARAIERTRVRDDRFAGRCGGIPVDEIHKTPLSPSRHVDRHFPPNLAGYV